MTGKCRPRPQPTIACSQPKEPGNCKDAGQPYFYFDVQKGSCESFTLYCGQPHNENAFKTLDACEAACVRPACDVPFVDGPCDAAIPMFSHDPNTGACKPMTYGGCGGTTNKFFSELECQLACNAFDPPPTKPVGPAVLIQGRSCLGFGEQLTTSGDQATFERDGTVLKKTMEWGCGCAKRPEFVMMYSPQSPIELRLCHDDGADSCEGICNAELQWDLRTAIEAAGTEDFVFVD